MEFVRSPETPGAPDATAVPDSEDGIAVEIEDCVVGIEDSAVGIEDCAEEVDVTAAAADDDVVEAIGDTLPVDTVFVCTRVASLLHTAASCFVSATLSGSSADTCRSPPPYIYAQRSPSIRKDFAHNK